MDSVADSESPYTNNHVDDIVKVENTLMEVGTNLSEKEWDAGMELALLNAISRCKPVGNKIKKKKAQTRIYYSTISRLFRHT